MDTQLPRFELDLPKHTTFTLADASGVAVSCVDGSVWITLDSDIRDIVLAPGERFSSDAHRRALVTALAPSRITVEVPRPVLAEARARAPWRNGSWRLTALGLSAA